MERRRRGGKEAEGWKGGGGVERRRRGGKEAEGWKGGGGVERRRRGGKEEEEDFKVGMTLRMELLPHPHNTRTHTSIASETLDTANSTGKKSCYFANGMISKLGQAFSWQASVPLILEFLVLFSIRLCSIALSFLKRCVTNIRLPVWRKSSSMYRVFFLSLSLFSPNPLLSFHWTLSPDLIEDCP